MAGVITATTTEYATMALLNTGLTGQTSAAATVGTSTTDWIITASGNGTVFYLTRLVRAA